MYPFHGATAKPKDDDLYDDPDNSNTNNSDEKPVPNPEQIFWMTVARFVQKHLNTSLIDAVFNAEKDDGERYYTLVHDAAKDALGRLHNKSSYYRAEDGKPALIETTQHVNDVLLPLLVEEALRKFNQSEGRATEVIEKLKPMHEGLIQAFIEASKPRSGSMSYANTSIEEMTKTIFYWVAKWLHATAEYLLFGLQHHSIEAMMNPPPLEEQSAKLKELLERSAENGERRTAVPRDWLEEYLSFLVNKPLPVRWNSETRQQEARPRVEVVTKPINVLNFFEKKAYQSTTLMGDPTYQLEYIDMEAFSWLWLWYGGGPQMTYLMCRRNQRVEPITYKAGVEVSFKGALYSSDLATIKVLPTLTGKELVETAINALSSEDARDKWTARLQKEDGIELTKKNYYSDGDPLDLAQSMIDELNEHTVTRFQVAPAGEALYKPGHCGLTNLGNTCYMNSALQCISNCTNFRNDFCEMELDRTKTPVAYELQQVLKKIWTGKNSSITQKPLREALCMRRDKYRGYEQQDAIEYVNDLLDIIHEELNPIKEKKYRQREDSDLKVPEKELADLYWKSYVENNQSIICDYFHGQMKSRFECLTCGLVSVVFDGIACLPVSIEKLEMWSYDIPLTFVDENGTRNVKVRIRIPADSPMSMVAAELRQHCEKRGWEPKHLVVLGEDKYSTDPLFPSPTKLFGKHDKAHAFIVPTHEPFHDAVEAALKRKEEAEKKKEEEEKRKREEAANAAKRQKLEDGERAQTDQEAAKKEVDTPRTEGEETPVEQGPVANPLAVVVTPEPPAAVAEEPEAEPEIPFIRLVMKIVPVSDSHYRYSSHMSSATAAQRKRIPIFVRYDVTEKALRDEVLAVASRFLRLKGEETDSQIDAVLEALEGVKLEFDQPVTRYSSDQIAVGTSEEARAFKKSLENTAFYVRYDDSKLAIATPKEEDDETLLTVPPNKKTKTQLTLEKCLSVKTHMLNGNDQRFCPACKTHTDAKHDEGIYRVPKTIIVHLKRFQFCMSNFTFRKLDTEVTFPLKLDFAPYLEKLGVHPTTKFQLNGVVHHSGSLAFGHYTASGLTNDEAWVDFNDSSATEMTGDPRHELAYLLFYQGLDQSVVIPPREGLEEEDDDDVTPVSMSPTSTQPFPNAVNGLTVGVDSLD